MPAILRRASGSGRLNGIHGRSSSHGESGTYTKAMSTTEVPNPTPPTAQNALQAQHSHISILQQYLVKIGRDPCTKGGDTGPSMGDVEAAKTVVLAYPAVPPRMYVRSRGWSTSILLVFMVACTGYFLYLLESRIIQTEAWNALPLVVLMPIEMLYFSYAAATMVNGLWNLLGSNKRLNKNSQTYSAVRTPVPAGSKLPQIVVQMPVYKESLDEVISKSYFNVIKAITHYISKGGVAKYIICDDGLQVISPDEAVARLNFYKKNNIAFVARSADNRRGVFKKASNLNYQLNISDKVKQYSQQHAVPPQQALQHVWKELNEEFVAGGDLTMDDDCLILLIDADTKIPETSMYDTVGEYMVDPGLAYTQHYTMPFSEQNRNYWELFISHFTKQIYFSGIAVATAYGDQAPLVGHNAFLRWSAVKQISFTDDEPNKVKYWSEDNVSEDFDLFIRLANNNLSGRYVMYTGEDFQEGVSLTYIDEIIKWRKFAYGACELLFNPLPQWLFKGPINKKFITYVLCPHILWHQKVALVMYLSSYLAMASAFPFVLYEGAMTILNPDFFGKFAVASFDVMLTCLVIFGGIGTFTGCMFKWRYHSIKGKSNILATLWHDLKYIPLTTIFFQSLLFHLTTACFMYFFSLKVSWGATAKESTNMTWFEALKTTLQVYWNEYLVYVIMTGGYAFCVYWYDLGMYRGWAVLSYGISHMLGPILLNPAIMTMSW
eukprot:jgi/Chrzof1/6539/Cz19g00110.t1